MEILKESALAAKLDFVRPIKSEPEPSVGVWCIPFEYGDNAKGTRISIAMAKTIAAELRAAVAEAEKQELRRAYDDERKRNEELVRRWSEEFDARQLLIAEIALLKKKARRRKKVSTPRKVARAIRKLGTMPTGPE